MTEVSMNSEALRRKIWRRQKRWMKRLAISSVLAGFAAGGWAFDAAPSNAGLKGILPTEVPEALSAEAFMALGPNWEAWSKDTVTAVNAFYALEGDAAAQQAALDAVKKRVKVLDKAISDPQYALILDPLLAIRGPLARRVALADAVWATLNADPEAARKAAGQTTAKKVEQALASLKSDLNALPGGPAWLPYIKADGLEKSWTESTSSDATIAALKTTHERLGKRNSLPEGSQKAFLSRPSFVALEGAIANYLAVVTQPAKEVDVAQIRQSLTELIAAIDDYDYTSSAVAAAEVRKSLDKVAATSPDAGLSIRSAVEAYYFQPNLQIAASENFLNRLLSDSRVEQGQVNDYVLGAAVGGWQTTNTNVTVDLKPAKDRVVFDLVLNGTVQSSTAGRTDQATIYTSGYHTFRSTKEVGYDGNKFSTGPASTAVNANNTTTGATTRLSGAPLFGQVAQRIAMREAAARRPQSEAIAAGRVSSNVTPKFDAEVNKAFTEATDQLQNQLFKGLKDAGLYPEQQFLSSTGTQMSILTRLMGDDRLGGSRIQPGLVQVGTGAAMLMHESVINNSIDQMDLNGKKLNEEQLRAHLEAFLSKALAREVKFQSPEEAEKPAGSTDATPEEKEPAQLVFTEYDPVRVQLRNGELLLVIRAGLERQNGEPIPAQEITVPLNFAVKGDKITITRGNLQILPIEGESMPIQQRVMNTRISSALPDREVPGTFKLRGPDRDVKATVSAIKIIDGWIAVYVQ